MRRLDRHERGAGDADRVGTGGSTCIVAACVCALFASACPPELPEEAAPCPCSSGYACCAGVCVAGERCPECEVDASGLDRSPACDCDSFLPMCVGARWDYDEFEPSTEAPVGSKRQVIVDYADPGDARFGKSGFNAFKACRTSDASLRIAWQSVEGPRTLWQMDQWFGPDRAVTRTAYYVEARLRLDESRTLPGDAWTDQHSLYTVVAEGNDVQPCDDGTLPTPLPEVPGGFLCEAETEPWSVVAIEDAQLLGMELGGFAPADVLCHAVERGTMKYYCFARGVGKFYELEAASKSERLVSYEVPGCGRSP